MRSRILAAAGLAAAAAALAVPGYAKADVHTHQVNVTVGRGSCTLQLYSVSRRNTTIVFHIIDNTALPAGILVQGTKSKFAPATGSADLIFKFRGPGTYPLRCVAGEYGRPMLVDRTSFTIRRS